MPLVTLEPRRIYQQIAQQLIAMIASGAGLLAMLVASGEVHNWEVLPHWKHRFGGASIVVD